MIRSFSYRDSRGAYVPYQLVEYDDGKVYHKQTKEELSESVEKMSKSLKNVINPDDVVRQYGADTLRLYEMAMGPLEGSKPWNTRDVPGVHRFLHRAWRLVVDPETAELAGAIQDVEPDEKLNRLRHKTIRKVGADIEALALNTGITALIVLVNELTPLKVRPREVVEDFVLLLSPFAPHIAEELWQRLGHQESLAYHHWPKYDEELASEVEMEMAVQVNGKLVERMRVAADADDETISKAARSLAKVAGRIEGKEIVKLIIARPRVVNIVVRE
jgi:leucyl-tRNA synthetase